MNTTLINVYDEYFYHIVWVHDYSLHALPTEALFKNLKYALYWAYSIVKNCICYRLRCKTHRAGKSHLIGVICVSVFI